MPFTKPVIVQGDVVHEVDVTVVPAPTGVATIRYAEISAEGAPVKPGAATPTVIAWEDAEAEVMVGAEGSAATIWKARVTFDAGA